MAKSWQNLLLNALIVSAVILLVLWGYSSVGWHIFSANIGTYIMLINETLHFLFTTQTAGANTSTWKHTAVSPKDIHHVSAVLCIFQDGWNRNVYEMTKINLLKRQRDKSIIKFYCLLTVCNLQTVTPSQMISESTEDDQTNTRANHLVSS